MARTTIGDVVSRIRNQMKSVNQDAFLTDRLIYSTALKHAAWLMKREDRAYKLMRYSSVIDTLDFVELEEIDKIEACCTGLKSCCTIKRSKDKLPIFMEGYWGPLIRAITSIDNSYRVEPTTPSNYVKIANSKNYKYNKTFYYWFINDYLYFPNIDWDAVRIEGIFQDDISLYNCDPEDACIVRQNQAFNVPDYLLGELEQNVLKDMGMRMQYPTDPIPNKENPERSS